MPLKTSRLAIAALICTLCANVVSAAITGNVFQDFNGNGIRNTASATVTATDKGIGGITVTAYGANNTSCGSAITATTGTVGSYTLTLSSTTGACAGPTYRIEFSGLPSNFKPSAHSIDSVSAGTANNAGSITQFVVDGATEVNLAINIPCDYCEDNAILATSRLVGSGTNNITAVLSFPLNAGIPASTTPNGTAEFVPTTHGLEINSQSIGAVWGSSFARQKKTLFYAAFQKRHAAYAKTASDPNGLNGSGRIYYVAKPSTGAGPATVTTQNLLVDLEALIPGSTKPAGDLHDPAAGWDNDNVAFSLVGRVGFGDVAVSRDESLLYAVSLRDKRIYRIPLSSPIAEVTSAASITSVDILTLANVPPATCSASSLIPGAINVNRYTGQIFFGLTCVAAGTAGINDPSLLRAFVYRWDGAAATAAEVANFPLNYARDCAASSNNNLSTCSNNAAQGANSDGEWLPWSDNQADLRSAATPGGTVFSQVSRPQPWLMNIDFDEANNMIVGLADRAGHQLGNNNGGASVGVVEGVSAGDTLRLPASTTTPGAGTWSAPPANGFYTGDNYGTGHGEITLGGFAFIPGANQVVSSAFDPVNPFNSNFRSGGVIWLNNGSGTKDRQYMVYGTDAAASFGKAAGMGDIELLCNPAPIEIGNRVWRDLNGNGIQDPNEPPLVGIEVQLVDTATGAVVGTSTTDTAGEYYFNATNVTDGDRATPGDQSGVAPNTNYIVRIANISGPSQQTALAGLVLTVTNSSGTGGAGSGDTTNDPVADVRDSDASVVGSGATATAEIAYNSGDAGNNNHGLDFGFRDPLFSLGNRVWFDTNNDGILNNGELPIAGVKVQLLDSANNPIAGQTVVTDANGYYRFDELAAGNYSVRITPDNWTGLSGSLPEGTTGGPSTALSGAPLAGYSNSTPDNAANGTGALNNTDKGITPATAAAYTTAGVTSAPVTLGTTPTTNQPTGDVDTSATGAGANGPDGDVNDNLTVDFGFYRLTVGDTLWLDNGAGGGTRNDGIRNGGEPGLPAGVVVELLKGGVVVASTTTDANGNYIFTQQNNQGTSTGTNGAPLVPGTDYQVRIPAGQAALNGTTSSTNPSSLPIPTSPGTATNDDGDSGTGTANAFANPTTTGNFALGASTSSSATPDSNGTYPVAQNGASNVGANHKPNVDLGFVPPQFAIGNRVWFDANNDGQINAGEVGTAGVKVELRDSANAVIATTMTDANGYYLFDNLAAGTYSVRIPQDNWTGIAAAAGVPSSAVGTSPLRGYANSTGVTNASATVTAADNNRDHGTDNATPATTGGVVSGPIAVGTPSPTSGVGTGDTTEVAPGTAPTSTAGDANDNLTIDFGFYRMTAGNQIWIETNGNSTYTAGTDATPASVQGITVELRDAATNAVVATTTTDATGNYQFVSLANGNPIPAGAYYVSLPTLPVGTSPIATGTALTDNNSQGALPGAPIAGVAVKTGTFNLAPGVTTQNQVVTAATGTTAQPTLDMGFAGTYSIGNRVWFDANNNGQVDGAEAGVNGVTVELLVESAPGSGTFNPTGTTLTTANGGYYRFDGLAAGNYRVRVNPSNFAAGGALRGYFTSGSPNADAEGPSGAGVNNDNNGIAPAAGNYVGLGVSSGTVTLGGATPEPTTDNTEAGTVGANTYNSTNSNGTAAPDNQYNASVDFGFHKVSIGNRVWFDAGAGTNTNNGILDSGELGVNGVTVELRDGAGNLIATTTTANVGGVDGVYMFMTDTAGNPLLASGTDTRQFRVVIPTPPTGAVSSTPTETSLTAMGDNRDHGAPGAGSAVQSNVFTLTPGATTNGQSVDNPTATTDQPQLDFGFVPQYSLGNRVWLDSNGDGVRQPSEPGRDGVVVNLLNSSGQPLYRQADGSVGTTVTANPITTTTADGGYYRFEGLPPGDYVVQLAPVNFQPGGMLYSATTSAPLPTTLTNVGGVDGIDNNSNGVTDANPGTNGIRSGTVTLGDGNGSQEPTGESDLSPSGQGSSDNRADMTVDFGFVPVTFALGNVVFVDTNNNGIRDSGENGIGSGVTVTLYADANNDGVPDGAAQQTTTTNGDGQYLFSGLPEGRYVVEISGAPLAGYTSSTGINGGASGPYEPGSTDFTAAGNNRDHGRNLSPGVIRSGTVTLGANMPTGEGSDLTVTDPNATPDNRTNLTVDFGVFRPASVGTVVWIDNGSGGGVSGDGTKQPGEQGIPGVIVVLLDGGGNPVDGDPVTPGVQQVTAVTGPNGEYQITNLVPGQYQVQFVFPPNSTITTTINPPGTGTPAVGPDNQLNEMNPTTRRTPVVTLAPGDNNPNLDSGVLSFSSTPQVVPTMNEWLRLLFALLVFATGAAAMRRRAR
jgi:hypothetical protein